MNIKDRINIENIVYNKSDIEIFEELKSIEDEISKTRSNLFKLKDKIYNEINRRISRIPSYTFNISNIIIESNKLRNLEMLRDYYSKALRRKILKEVEEEIGDIFITVNDDGILHAVVK